MTETATDGSPMVYLGGRFAHAPILQRNPDGTVTVSCANELRQVPEALGGQGPSGGAPRARELK